MTDISELERRISYALERIARSADRVVNHAPIDDDRGVHPDPLSEELKERLAQLSHDYDTQGAALLEARATLEALSESNRALRAGAVFLAALRFAAFFLAGAGGSAILSSASA